MIQVLIASKQSTIREKLQSYLSQDPDMELTGTASGSDDALEKVENLSPNLLVIYSGGADNDAISMAERIVLRKPRTFVVLILQEMTLENMQAASAAGCHNVTGMPESAKEFCDYLHRVFNTESGRITALDQNERVTWSSKVISVYGAKGGLGKTTIATNLAIKLAEKKKKVVVVDLDLQYGDVHIFLDIDPKETISDLMQEPDNITIDAMRSFLNIHPSGVHVLCAPKSPEYAEMVSGERIQTLLSLLRSYYDYVIIDTAANFADTTLSALEASSSILFVTGLDVSILKNSKVAMGILDSLGQKKKVHAIINRAVEISSITIADVQRIVDAPILARIPSDYMMAVAALNQGIPFVQSTPKAKLSLAISDMADKIDSGEDQFDIQQLSKKERRALMKKYRTKEKAEKKSLFRK